MFGLSWAQIAIIVLVGVFVLGPERIPTAVTWAVTSLRKVRTMAAGAQAELRREIGPEIDELRRQVADLQSLKEIQELRDLRDLHPKRLIGKNILGDEFSGGITGFLGLTDQPTKPSAPGPGAVSGTSGGAAVANDGGDLPKPGAGPGPAAEPGGAPAAFSASRPAATPPKPAGSLSPTRPAGPPSLAKLPAPKVVGHFTPRAQAPSMAAGDRPPYDIDGT